MNSYIQLRRLLFYPIKLRVPNPPQGLKEGKDKINNKTKGYKKKIRIYKNPNLPGLGIKELIKMEGEDKNIKVI